MDKNKFLEFFSSINQTQKYFDVERFYKEKYSENSPVKLRVSYQENSNELKNAIVKNLAINPFFRERPKYLWSDLEKFYNFVHSEESDDNHIARLVFLLHLSKGNLNKVNFIFLLNRFETISIIDTNDANRFDPYFFRLFDLFEKLKSNEALKNKIYDTIRLTGWTEIDFNFNQLVLVFFDSEIEKLYGYAGVNKIYVNYLELLEFMNILKCSNIGNNVDRILDFEFVRIFIHEVSHVILRSSTKNLNVSTPKIEKDTTTKPLIKILELGQQMEKVFFKDRIDWKQSFMSKSFNFGYCCQFFDEFFEGKIPSFDFKKAGVKAKKDKGVLMCIDCDFDNVWPSIE